MHAPRRTPASRFSWPLPCLLVLLLLGACSKNPGGGGGSGGDSNSGSGGEPGGTQLDCVLAEGFCEQDADCCVAPCLGNFCFFVPDGNACTDTKQCRNSSACIDGVCAAVPCRSQGMPCNGTGCCSGLDCVDQHCVPQTCSTEGQDCFPACCAGLRCDASVCTSACGLTAAACTEDTECCDGYRCLEGSCTAICSYNACGPSPDGQLIECCLLSCSDGGLCEGCNMATCTSDAECCDGAPCIDGTCGCVEEDGACGQTGACCDGTCKDGSCACVPKGEACTFALQCCGDLLCMGGICRLETCEYNLGACDHPTDCCDGVCTDGTCCTGSGLTCPAVGAGCCNTAEGCIGDPPTCRSDCIPAGEFGCSTDTHCCESSCDSLRQVCRPVVGQDCTLADLCQPPMRCGQDGLCCQELYQSCAAEPEGCCDDMVCGEQGACCFPNGTPCEYETCCELCRNGVCGPRD